MKTAQELAGEFPEQNPGNFEHDAALRLNDWGIEAHAMLRQQADQIESLRIERDALKQQAQIHAMEAKTANSTIYDIYQVVSGGTGEPGNWNGARPVREAFDALKADAKRLDLLESTFFAKRWNGVIDSGSRTTWCIVPGYRHSTNQMVGHTFRAAIDAMKGKS